LRPLHTANPRGDIGHTSSQHNHSRPSTIYSKKITFIFCVFFLE
jgi:hypothetical protein